MIEQILSIPLVQVILVGLFVGAFILSAMKNAGSDDDNKSRRNSRQAGDDDE